MKRPISLQFQDDVAATYMPKSKLIGLYNSIFVLFSILLISFFFSSTAFAQLKSNAVEQAEAQLIVVNEKIAEIDAKISAINTRIAGIPVENVDPSVYVRLNDLQLTKEQYTREKISIEAVLETNQNDGSSDGLEEFPSSNNPLPKNNQDQRLEYTNRIE
jgi:hypothetical protein